MPGRLREAAALALVLGAVHTPRPAAAFVRTTMPSGDPAEPGRALFWCTRQPSFVINENGSSDAGKEASFAAVRRSFETWAAPDCADLSFVDLGTTARSEVGLDGEGVNLVVWREVSCQEVVPAGASCLEEGGCNNEYGCWEQTEGAIAVTTTTFDNRTGQILDSDIELNGAGFAFTTVDAPRCTRVPAPGANDCVATDVQNTVTHEIGHFIGLAHTADPNATMYATEPQGETDKRDLSEDDVAGVCAIYPQGEAPPSFCSESESGGTGGGGGSQGGCGCSSQPAGDLSALALLVAAGALLRHC